MTCLFYGNLFDIQILSFYKFPFFKYVFLKYWVDLQSQKNLLVFLTFKVLPLAILSLTLQFWLWVPPSKDKGSLQQRRVSYFWSVSNYEMWKSNRLHNTGALFSSYNCVGKNYYHVLFLLHSNRSLESRNYVLCFAT